MIWLAIMLIAVPMFFFIGAAIFEIHLARDPLPRAMSALAPRHHRDPSREVAKRLGLRQSSGAFPEIPPRQSARGLAHSKTLAR